MTEILDNLREAFESFGENAVVIVLVVIAFMLHGISRQIFRIHELIEHYGRKSGHGP